MFGITHSCHTDVPDIDLPPLIDADDYYHGYRRADKQTPTGPAPLLTIANDTQTNVTGTHQTNDYQRCPIHMNELVYRAVQSFWRDSDNLRQRQPPLVRKTKCTIVFEEVD